MSNKALVAASVNAKREHVGEDGGPMMESLEGRQMMSVTPVAPLGFSFGVERTVTSDPVVRYHLTNAWPQK